MRILIADDDAVSRTVLKKTLTGWGHDVIAVADGVAAWDVLRRDDAPKLAVLDWMMPGLEGPEVCRMARGLGRPVPTHVILLTSKGDKADLVAGFAAGADDYVTKPFDRDELRSRLQVGERMVGLHQGLADRVTELEAALARVRRLHGLLPVCAWCNHVRNDRDYWQSVEEYVAELTHCQISHGICPTCLARETAAVTAAGPAGDGPTSSVGIAPERLDCPHFVN